MRFIANLRSLWTSRRELTRREAWGLLLLLFLGSALLRLLLSRTVHSFIIPDEWLYLELARSLPLGHGAFWGRIATGNPCWFYPLLLSPLLAWLPMVKAYAAIHLLNALLITLTVGPAYGLAREVGSRRQALLAACLVALMPGGCYSGTIMTENAFFPVVTLGFWLIYRAAARPGFGRCLLAGLACGFSYFIKPHGILMPLIAGLTIALFEAPRLYLEAPRLYSEAPRLYSEAPEPWPRRVTPYVLALLRHWPMALGFLLVVSLRFVQIFIFERPSHFNPKLFFGYYNGMASGRFYHSPWEIMLSFAGYLGAWVVSAGLLPAWTLARELPPALRGRSATPAERPVALLAILAAVSSFVILAIAARHCIVYDNAWTIHERYFFIFMTPLLVLFAIRGLPLRAGLRPWALRLLLVLFFIGFLAFGSRWDLWVASSNCPTFCGPGLFFLFSHLSSYFWVGLYCLPLAVGLGLFLRWWGPGRTYPYLSVALLFLAGNLGWYGHHAALDRSFRPTVNHGIERHIAKKMQPADRLIILTDALDSGLVNLVGIWTRGELNYLADPKPRWYSRPLQLAADGTVGSPFPLDNTWLLASSQVSFNRRPAKRFDTCALYRLDSRQPLRLDRARTVKQVAAFPSPGSTSMEAAAGKIALSYTAVRLPDRWKAGSPQRISLEVRNDSPFWTPGGSAWLSMGYQWQAPRVAGGKLLSMHKNQEFKVPAGIAPGQSFGLSMTIRAPDSVGAGWQLHLVPCLRGVWPKVVFNAAKQYVWSGEVILQP